MLLWSWYQNLVDQALRRVLQMALFGNFQTHKIPESIPSPHASSCLKPGSSSRSPFYPLLPVSLLSFQHEFKCVQSLAHALPLERSPPPGFRWSLCILPQLGGANRIGRTNNLICWEAQDRMNPLCRPTPSLKMTSNNYFSPWPGTY